MHDQSDCALVKKVIVMKHWKIYEMFDGVPKEWAVWSSSSHCSMNHLWRVEVCWRKTLLDVYWKCNRAERKTAGRLLKCVEKNFLIQLVCEPIRKGAPLDLIFADREGFVGDVMVGGHPGHSDCETHILHCSKYETFNPSTTLHLESVILYFQSSDGSLFKLLDLSIPIIL